MQHLDYKTANKLKDAGFPPSIKKSLDKQSMVWYLYILNDITKKLW